MGIKARFFSDSFDSLGSTNPSFDEGCVRGAALWRCAFGHAPTRYISRGRYNMVQSKEIAMVYRYIYILVY